jgi:RNA polymerase sigma-70 factor (ECF subfamily)
LKNEDRKTQQWLYDKYAPILLGICRRYVKITEDAEDVLIDTFFKIFTNIHQYKGDGSFEGWMKRIAVNESLMLLRKNHNFRLTVEISNIEISTKSSALDNLKERDVMALLEKLPTGYRTIFNMYVVEGYKHREIAEILKISINTSKSQLILAKKRLRALLNNQELGDVG